jgi:carbonic anhydrase/acetyltransferase-like protein (isoleucine patch superfamily)
MLAAGAMLTPGKIINEAELWAGRPAKFLRMLTDKEIEKNRSMAEHYRKIAEQHKCDAEGRIATNPYP